MTSRGRKVALISGSTRGIGFAIAQALYREGCIVILNGLTPARLDNAMKQLPGSYGVVADVTDPSQCDHLAEYILQNFGQLDHLICNVGSGRSVPPGEESFEEWQRVFAVNLWSTTNLVQSCKQLFIEQHSSIVAISSICGQEVIQGAPITYSTAKSALNAYIRGIARPLGLKGIRINGIALGNILFEGSIWEQKLIRNESDVMTNINTNVSLQRFGTLEDVATLTCFLLSNRSRFCTGAIWNLDGGQIRH